MRTLQLKTPYSQSSQASYISHTPKEAIMRGMTSLLEKNKMCKEWQ